MKKEQILIAVVALIVGLLGGFLVFKMGADKSSGGVASAPSMPMGAGSPTDYAKRIAEAEKIVSVDPKNLQAWVALANDYFDTDQAQKAVNAYGKALELGPANPNLLTDQGVMYRRLGQFDKAITNFEKAQQLDPKHLQSLYNLGVVYAADLKKNDKAIETWNKYLTIDSSSASAMQIKGMIEQVKAGQFK